MPSLTRLALLVAVIILVLLGLVKIIGYIAGVLLVIVFFYYVLRGLIAFLYPN